MSDALKTLEAVTGIDRARMTTLWEEVKENGRKLNSCARHDFAKIEPIVTMNQKYQCIHCLGTIDGIAHSWYSKGRAHA